MARRRRFSTANLATTWRCPAGCGTISLGKGVYQGSAIVKKSLILAVLAASSLALTALSAPVYAQSTKSVRLAKNQKLCRSKRPDGSIKTWTCGAQQPCCVNHFFNLYTCGSELLKCL